MATNPVDHQKELAELDDLIKELRSVTSQPQVRADAEAKHIDIEGQISKLESRRTALMKQAFANLTHWDKVKLARHPERPYTLDYILNIFDDFIELHGL